MGPTDPSGPTLDRQFLPVDPVMHMPVTGHARTQKGWVTPATLDPAEPFAVQPPGQQYGGRRVAAKRAQRAR